MLLETIISVDLVFLSLGFIATPVLILKVLFGIPGEEEVRVHCERVVRAVYSSLSGGPAFYLNERFSSFEKTF
jgi:hypothetical protein